MNTRRRRSVAGSRGIQNRESGFMNGLPYSEAELRDLVERGEGQFLEFKSAWDRSGGRRRTVDRRAVRDAIAESVAAFANADGGTLLVGVEDDGTPSGHGYPDDAVADLLAVPRRRLQPDASCRTGRCTVGGVEILVFEVAIAPEAVMIDGNGFPYRVGDRIVRQPQEAINQRKEAYRQVGYERRFRHEATLDDLDLGLAQTFLDRTPIRGTPVVSQGSGALPARRVARARAPVDERGVAAVRPASGHRVASTRRDSDVPGGGNRAAARSATERHAALPHRSASGNRA